MRHSRPLWYAPDGTPLADFTELAQYQAEKVVKQERVWWGGFVSTVWLGLDHSFGDGPPLIYETMVFPPHSYDDLKCDRYPSRKAATIGHTTAVRWARWRGLWEWGSRAYRNLAYKVRRVLRAAWEWGTDDRIP